MPTENKPADPKPTGLSQGWNLTRKHDGFVVGHQSVAYPPGEKAIERAKRDGYVWVPFLVPAAQPQGEPVAEIVSKYGDPEAFGERELITLKGISKFPYGTKLYAEQPAPVAVVLPERLAQILKFLEGAESLDGYWFGEPGPHGSKVWWRAELRKALTETNLFAKQQ